MRGGAAVELKEPDAVYSSNIMRQLSSPAFWTVTLVSNYLILRSNFYTASMYNQMHTISYRDFVAYNMCLSGVDIT